jgi:hypothetical protein
MSKTMQFSRRDALKSISSGFGYLAFAALAAEQARAENPLSLKQPHFAPRAKRVIFLSMRGAPSHIDTFDYKPQLIKDTGKTGKYGGSGTLLGSPWKFKQRGESGLWISDLFPSLSEHADDLCLLRGMHCDQPNHPQATAQTHTGSFQFPRPSMGAWTLYGLGTENTDLPAGRNEIMLGRTRRGDSSSEDFPDISNPNLNGELQRMQLDFVQELNRNKLQRDVQQPQVEGMIESFELAFRMQAEMPDALDLSSESQATLDMYGIGNQPTENFGRQCLLARRLAERGVRFIECISQGWDHHRNLREEMEDHCAQIDRPIAGLLQDLQQRNLLEDTLVIWAGEFGRTPHAQNGDGRDHNNKGYTTWMAGGGVKGGMSYGATDHHGYEAVEGKCHIHDWHATILHLLGLDHEQLTYRYAGRDFRLTDVYGRVAKDIIS